MFLRHWIVEYQGKIYSKAIKSRQLCQNHYLNVIYKVRRKLTKSAIRHSLRVAYLWASLALLGAFLLVLVHGQNLMWAFPTESRPCHADFTEEIHIAGICPHFPAWQILAPREMGSIYSTKNSSAPEDQ